MQEDLEMMRNPNRWPCWPFLPLKRSTDKGPEYGLLYEPFDGNFSKATYKFAPGVTMYDIGLSPKFAAVEAFSQQDADAKFKDLVNDGWVVD